MDRAAAYSYRIVVFGLKGNQRLDDAITLKKLLSYRSVFVAEHPPDPADHCEYTTLHYHALVEHKPEYRFDCDRIWNQFKLDCAFFKSEACKMPVNFLAYMQIPPKQIVYRNEVGESAALHFLADEVTPKLIQEVKERREGRDNKAKEASGDIQVLVRYIQTSGAQSEAELVNQFHREKKFEDIYCKRTFTSNFKKALQLAIQKTLDLDLYDLVTSFVDKKNECLTPRQSFNIVVKWCDFQKIKPKKFIMAIMDCMDKKKRKLNTVAMIGEPNSGKTFIAKSICKAVVFYGEVCQGIAGYSFMWQDCINKRVIIINEPYIDNCMIEQLKYVLEGTGCFVHKKNSGDEYLRPTPVIVTANHELWRTCPQAKTAILSRYLAHFTGLRKADFLAKCQKDLHPGWIKLMCDKYINAIDSDDDECRYTIPDIDTVVPEPTLKQVTETEVQSTPSTSAVDDTTKPILKEITKEVINDSNKKPVRPDSLETLLVQSSPPRACYRELPATQDIPWETEWDDSPPQTPKRRSEEPPRLHRKRRRSPTSVEEQEVTLAIRTTPEKQGAKPWMCKRRLDLLEEPQWEADKYRK